MTTTPDIDFEEIYQPKEFPQTVTGNPILLETFGPELEQVQAIHQTDPKTVWTIVEGDSGELHVVAGFHFVDRINYLITKKPWETGEETFPWS